MVRFKTRWLLLAIDDQPQAKQSPFLSNKSSDIKVSSAASSLTAQAITRLLRASLLTNFGDVAAGSFGGVLMCKYYSAHTGTAIVRCTRDGARMVWAAATLISSASELPSPAPSSSLRIRVVHCGGTIKKLQTKAIELDRRTILRLRRQQNDVHKKLSSATIRTASIADDSEDIGEALDSAEHAATPSMTSGKGDSHVDPHTAALLAASKKEISSVTM